MSDAAEIDGLDEREDVDRLAWWAFQAISVIGAILFFFFGWLQLRFTPVISYIQNTTPEIITKGTLILYCACWIAGCSFETWMQQKVYVSDPHRGEMTKDLFGAIIAMGVASIALVWASSHQQFFSLILLGFTVANIVGWWLIAKRIKPIITASQAELLSRRNFFRLEQLRLIEAHVIGDWQKLRFAIMVFIALFGVLVYYSSPTRSLLAKFVESSPLSIPAKTAANLLPPVIYLFFVLVAESWIWIRRENIRAMLSATDKLKKRYRMDPVPKRD